VTAKHQKEKRSMDHFAGLDVSAFEISHRAESTYGRGRAAEFLDPVGTRPHRSS
jgi:hypothetical protein